MSQYECKPLFTNKTEPIAWSEAYGILEDPREEVCVKVPPVKPKAGEVFYFQQKTAKEVSE